MNKASYQRYLLTPKWRATAKKAIKRAHGRCQVCGNLYRLEVHHNTYRNIGREKPEDLCVLCARCHALFHDIIVNIGPHSPQRPGRLAVREKVACPTCGVPAGELCLGHVGGAKRRKRRAANHVARVNAFLDL